MSRSRTKPCSRCSPKTTSKKYRYVMSVSETVKSSTTIESDRPMLFAALSQIAERRRVKGDLSLVGVEDVCIGCDEVYVDGKLVEE